MKKRLFQLTVLLAITFFITGCDSQIRYQYNLINNSDSILIIKFRCIRNEELMVLNYFENDSVVKVLPKTDIQFFEANVIGSNPYYDRDDFLQVFDTISITLSNQIPINTDIYKRGNWKYDRNTKYIGTVRVGTNIYKLELTNDDLIQKRAR
jgi:hypothetical protein